MERIWHRIETWLGSNAPSMLQSLAPGATDDELLRFESELGRRLPEDVALSYRIHDGQREGWGIPERFLYGDQLYPLSKAIEKWDGLKDLPSELEATWMVRPQGPASQSGTVRSAFR